MKITDSVKKVPGVEIAYWNGPLNQLTVYYNASLPLNTVKLGVVAQVTDDGLGRAVDKYVFISL